MRLQRGVRTFAAVVTAAAITAPAGQAKFDNTTYPPLGNPRAIVDHHHGSTDWTLIGLSAAGAATLVGAGVATSRRLGRGSVPGAHARTASES